MAINHLTYKPMFGRQLNYMHPLVRGLIGCWLFNAGCGHGGSIQRMPSGTPNSAWANTPTGNPTYAGGAWGCCMDFDGSADRVYLNRTSTPTTCYISVWVQFDALGSKKVIWTWGGAYSLSIMLYSSRWNFYSEINGFDIWPSSPVPVIGTWHHVVCGFVGGVRAELYVDGVLIGYDNAITTPSGSTWLVGGVPVSATYTIDGRVDHLMAWDRKLIDAEVCQLYRRPYSMFTSDL